MLSVPPVLPPTTEHETDADLLSWKQRRIKKASFHREGAPESSSRREIASKRFSIATESERKRKGTKQARTNIAGNTPQKVPLS